MKVGGYLTIEEAAKKLGKPVSWVKGQILAGKLGATLSGRQWLIAPRDFEALLINNPPPPEPRKVVHNFLPDQPTKKPYRTPKTQKVPARVRDPKPKNRSGKASSSSKRGRTKKGKSWQPTLTQKIVELDREFEELSARLKSEMIRYKAGVRSGRTVELPTSLLRRWKSTRSELRFLIAKAGAKGLVLPTNLSINRDPVCTENSEDVKRRPPPRTPRVAGGIDGYYAADRPEKRHWFNEED